MSQYEPLYAHDCDSCTFLGTFTYNWGKRYQMRDLYTHRGTEGTMSILVRLTSLKEDLSGLGGLDDSASTSAFSRSISSRMRFSMA